MADDHERMFQTVWGKIDAHADRLQRVEVDNKVLKAHVDRMGNDVAAMRDTLKEQHGETMAAVSALQISMATHQATQDTRHSTKKDFGASAVAIITVAISAVSVLVTMFFTRGGA